MGLQVNNINRYLSQPMIGNKRRCLGFTSVTKGKGGHRCTEVNPRYGLAGGRYPTHCKAHATEDMVRRL